MKSKIITISLIERKITHTYTLHMISVKHWSPTIKLLLFLCFFFLILLHNDDRATEPFALIFIFYYQMIASVHNNWRDLKSAHRHKNSHTWTLLVSLSLPLFNFFFLLLQKMISSEQQQNSNLKMLIWWNKEKQTKWERKRNKNTKIVFLEGKQLHCTTESNIYLYADWASDCDRQQLQKMN